MTDQENNLEEWMAEERERLQKGFTFEPQPTSGPSEPTAGDQMLAGLGLGAGVAGGLAAGHPDSVSFEGVKPAVIVNALKSEVADDDTHVQVEQARDSVVVTILQSQTEGRYDFSPAVTVTLIETAEALTVTVSDLNQSSVRETLSSAGSTILDHGKRLLFRRRGVGGLIDTAGNMIEGVGDLVEDIQDLNLPGRVWAVIDRVGMAAEKAYLDEQRRKREQQQKREAAERAWTNCEWCGRAYAENEASLTTCPTCGGTRGPKPAWLQ